MKPLYYPNTVIIRYTQNTYPNIQKRLTKQPARATMPKDILEGEVIIVAVYLDQPENNQPSGEPINRSFFLTTEDGVTQLDRVVEEPYIVEWIDSKAMRLTDVLNRRLVYEADDGMSCDIEQDILPVEAPRLIYAMIGSLRQVETAEQRADTTASIYYYDRGQK